MKDDFFRRRLADLAAQAERTGRTLFTDFLTEAEYGEYLAVRNTLPHCETAVSGGHPDAERVMLRFGSGEDEPFPIACIQIAPVQEKFADALTHRDFLGALMHLGIERSLLGDIVVDGKCAFLFCRAHMAEFICGGLTRIRHTSVRCTLCTEAPQLAPKTEPLTVQVASLRADAVIAKVFRLSRGDCLTLFRAEKVFIAGAAVAQGSTLLKEGDRVSVRGYGKFRFAGVTGTTRKGNLLARVDRFV